MDRNATHDDKHSRLSCSQLPPPVGVSAAIADYKNFLRGDFRSVTPKFIPVLAEEDFGYPIAELEPSPDSDDEFGAASDALVEGITELDIDRQEAESSQGGRLEPEVDDEDRPARVLRSGDVLEVLRTVPRCVLTGAVGVGKTSSLRQLALEAVSQSSSPDEIPLFLSLAQFTKEEDILNFVSRVSGLDRSQLDYLLESNQIWLLMDGLDECPNESRNASVTGILGLLLAWPNLRLIVTCADRELAAQIGLPCYAVRPLDVERQLQVLSGRIGSDERAAELLTHIRAHDAGAFLANNPQMLTIAAEVAQKEPLAATSALILRQSFRIWYGARVRESRESGRTFPYSFGDILEKLAKLAFQLRLQGVARVAPWSTARSILEDDFASPNQAEDFLRHIGQGTWVAADAEEGAVVFEHKRYIEYLAAEYLLKEPYALERQAFSPPRLNAWGMIFVYAFELTESPPASLILTSWAVDPLSPMLALRQYPPALYGMGTYHDEDPFILDIINLLLHAPRPNRLNFAYPRIQSLCRLSDWSISHLFQASHLGQERLRSAKQHWIKHHVAVIVALAQRGLLCPEDFNPADLRKRFLKTPGVLSRTGWFRPNDFQEHERQKLAKRLNPRELCELLKNGVLHPADVTDEVERCLSKAGPASAGILIAAGLATANMFSSKLRAWLKDAETAPISFSLTLVRYGFASVDDLAERFLRWIQAAKNPGGFARFVKSVVDPERLTQFRLALLQAARLNPKSSAELRTAMIDRGLARPDDFCLDDDSPPV